MKNLFYKNLKALTLCAGFFSLNACKEKSIVKPGDLIPPVDNINTFEAKDFAISLQNAYYDSLRANDYRFPIVALGQVSSDAFFGKTSAGVYMQFIPSMEYFKFPENISGLDSIVLILPYSGFSYGDTDRTITSNSLRLKAYEITDPEFRYADSTIGNWYSPKEFQHSTTAIGSGEITLKTMTDTSFLFNGDKEVNLLRLPLDASVGNYILSLSEGDLATSSAFINKFKGILLSPDTTQNKNTLGYFYMSGASSQNSIYQTAHLQLFYHVAGDTALKRSIFPFTLSCAYSNNIKRNYSGSPAQQFLNTPTLNRDTMLVQSYPGFRSDVTIKLDDKIPASIVNLATLEITVARTNDQNRFNPPTQLIVNRINSDNTISPVMDVVDGNGQSNTDYLIFLDGKPKLIEINGVEHYKYAINLPREIQRTLSLGEKELKLRITTAQVYPGAHRMVAFGPNATEDTKIRLKVIYTKQN